MCDRGHTHGSGSPAGRGAPASLSSTVQQHVCSVSPDLNENFSKLWSWLEWRVKGAEGAGVWEAWAEGHGSDDD